MAYYIFLKSLRSLEEFRKNPHVKIPHKSPSTNFQSLDKFKNPILIQKFIFFLNSARPTPRPAWPLAQPAHWPRRSPQAKSTRPARPARASVAYSREIHFPFQIMPSRVDRLLPLSPPRGPRLSASSSPPRWPTPVRIFPTPPLPHVTAPRLRCPRASTALPHHIPLLIPFKPSVNGP
jgi:hypothetical protein